MGILGRLAAWTLVAAAGGAAWSASGLERSIEAERLVVRNLIGRVEVEGSSGSAFEVVVVVQGADAGRDLIDVVVEEGREAELNVVFPVNQHRDYVYPELGRSNVRFNPGGAGSSSWIGRLFGDGSIEVTGDGPGLEVWADVTIRVPRGAGLYVEHGVGETVAHDVHGALTLDTSSGGVRVETVEGPLVVDTGSGEVRVVGVRGSSIRIDTGSGRVEAAQLDGAEVSIDTGSGRVEVDRVHGDEVNIDTGSGGVEATGLDAERLTIDTGSGAVSVEIANMARGRFRIDTGSGAIDLRVPADASARIIAETGSGSVSLDLGDGVRVLRQEPDGVELQLGSGAAHVELDTGSGAIRIKH
jgi:hypothetical protein